MQNLIYRTFLIWLNYREYDTGENRQTNNREHRYSEQYPTISETIVVQINQYNHRLRRLF